jgi:uncharacterized protein with HEPN domain
MEKVNIELYNNLIKECSKFDLLNQEWGNRLADLIDTINDLMDYTGRHISLVEVRLGENEITSKLNRITLQVQTITEIIKESISDTEFCAISNIRDYIKDYEEAA